MKDLRSKSLHELRGIAQALGIDDIFEKLSYLLVQEIELKQQELMPKVVEKLPDRRAYDARLMSRPPSRISNSQELVDALEDHIALGLNVKITAEEWEISCGKKSDCGTLRMPLRQILLCADKVIKP